MRYLAEAVSKQRVARVAWFFLTLQDKMWKEREMTQMKLLIKKEIEIKDLGKSQWCWRRLLRDLGPQGDLTSQS